MRDLVVTNGFIPGLYTFQDQWPGYGQRGFPARRSAIRPANAARRRLPGTCPRTIGYWKNNVEKVFDPERTTGVQERPETLDKALDSSWRSSAHCTAAASTRRPDAIPRSASVPDATKRRTILIARSQESALYRRPEQHVGARSAAEPGGLAEPGLRKDRRQSPWWNSKWRR